MTPAERENRNLRAEVGRLRAALEDARFEIRALKAARQVAGEKACVEAFRLHFAGISPGDAWVLAAMHKARGRVVSKAAVLEQMPSGRRDERKRLRILHVRITNLRVALGREAIKTHNGVGYELTPAGLAACDAAIAKQDRA